MFKLVSRRSEKAGMPPGSLVYVGEEKAEETVIGVVDYLGEECTALSGLSVEDCLRYRDTPSVTWINVAGLEDVVAIERLGLHFGLHPLTIEDILNTEQRPKLDMLEGHVLIVTRMVSSYGESEEVDSEQISIVLGENFVITFQESSTDAFGPIRDRIEKNKGSIRTSGADYLAYCILDTVVDGYFGVIERLDDEVERLEDELIAEPTTDTLQGIHFIKREVVLLRRSVWPLREVIGRLERGETPLVRPSTAIYIRDLYDHTIQVLETLETLRDLVSGMLDIYLSTVSNRMNQVVKVLTIIATIFIPLTFIAGVYGMNFAFMPELKWRWGYPAVWGVMVALAGAMLVLFRRKRWL